MISLCYSGTMNETETVQLTFGKALRFRRMQMGMTQRQLADRMAVAQNTLSRWESMADAPRDPYIVDRLAELLMMDPADLRAGRMRRVRGPEGVREELQRIAMDHAETPEDVEALTAIMEGALSLNPEGLRRVEDYLALLVERFGRSGTQEDDAKGDHGSGKTAM